MTDPPAAGQSPNGQEDISGRPGMPGHRPPGLPGHQPLGIRPVDKTTYLADWACPVTGYRAWSPATGHAR